jgi:3-oxoadipate enol-lactonase
LRKAIICPAGRGVKRALDVLNAQALFIFRAGALTMRWTMPLVKRKNNATLHYRVDDFTDSWQRAGTIVLQHGYARSSLFWQAWIPYLSRFFRIVRPELRGHAGSPVDFDPARDSTLGNYVADIVAVLDELKLDSVHYCGESFGGIIGMALAAEHPQRVRTLTLVSSPVFQNQQSQDVYAAGYPTREEALRTLGTRKWAEKIYGAADFFPDGTAAGLRKWYLDQIAGADAEVLCGLYGLLRHANASDLLPRIAAPVLGLYPTGGLLTTNEQETLLRAGIRNLRLIHLPAASHAIMTLFPAACATHLLQFAAQHDGIVCREQ